MPTDTSVNNLVINKLTKAQYSQIQNPIETELYLVPDEVDTTPTSGSSNCVTSGGVYTALSAYDSVIIETSLPNGSLVCGTYYSVELSSATTVTLPTVTGSYVKSIVLFVTLGSGSSLTINPTSPDVILYQDGLQDMFTNFTAGDKFEINCQWNGAAWVIAGIKIIQAAS